MPRVIYVVEPGTRIVARKGGAYLIKMSGERVAITPDTEQVIIASSRVGITSKALRALARMGTDVVILDPLGNPVARLHQPIINKTVITRLKQFEVTTKRTQALELARKIITCKIENQATLLKYLSKNYREDKIADAAYRMYDLTTRLMTQEAEKLSEELIMSIEAQAAKEYWSTIAQVIPGNLAFTGRNPEGDDLFNMALNYGYGILYTTCERELIIAGLDPYLGILHTYKSGKPSLTLDFIEMFRPIAVDKPLILNARKLNLKTAGNYLDYESRKEISKAILENLDTKLMYTKKGRRMELKMIIRHEAWDLARAFREEDTKNYNCYRAVL